MADYTQTGLNRGAIGKKFKGGPYTITEEDIIKYAQATNDSNPYYVDTSREGGIVAPPIFPVKVLRDVFFQSFLDPEVHANVLMLVHSSQDMIIHEYIRPGDVIVTEGEIIDMVEKSSGDIVFAKYLCLKDGKVMVEAKSGFFIRLPGAKKSKKGKKDEKKEEESVAEVLFEDTMKVDADQTYRYAEASGDNNPIHIDENVAKQAGLGGVILHGLCTMAFASRAIVQKVLNGNPFPLKQISVNFTNIVRPLDVLTTKGFLDHEDETEKVISFATYNQNGVKVLDRGKAVIKK